MRQIISNGVTNRLHLLMAEIFGLVPAGGLNLKGLIESHIDILENGLIQKEQPA